MSFRPNIPDHIRKAILSGDRELLRRAGAKGAKLRRSVKAMKNTKTFTDGKSRATGERD